MGEVAVSAASEGKDETTVSSRRCHALAPSPNVVKDSRPTTSYDASRRNSHLGRFASLRQHHWLRDNISRSRDAKRPMSAFPREAWERGQSLFIRLDLAAISSGERGQLAQQINFDVFPP